MTADLAAQTALRYRLINTPAIIALVPAKSILDRNSTPAPDPSIIIGEGQCIEGGDIARKVLNVVLDLHLWKKEKALVGVKAIAGEVRSAIHSSRLDLETGFHCADCRVSSVRYLRDPDGETSHAIVTVEMIVREA